MNGDFEGSVNSQLTKEREKRHKKELEEENAITKINLDKVICSKLIDLGYLITYYNLL